MTNRLDRDFHLPGLLRVALPTIIMMLVVSLYTIVDGVLIALSLIHIWSLPVLCVPRAGA